MTGEHCDDPHVERMIESFALLGARINKKLDDDYPEFTEALVDVLYPHYLRSFPSCSIAQFTPSANVSQQTAPHRVARGTELKSRAIRGVQCQFRTAYDVTIAPIRISEARYSSIAAAPAATVLPGNATGVNLDHFRIDGAAVRPGRAQAADAARPPARRAVLRRRAGRLPVHQHARHLCRARAQRPLDRAAQLARHPGRLRGG